MSNWVSQVYKKKSVFAKNSFSALISKVAVTAVALSILVMLLSFSVLRGFKGLVKEKMAGFSGHIQVLSAKSAINYEYEPYLVADSQLSKIAKTKGVKNVFPIIQKAGIAKSTSDLEGLVLKGLAQHYDSLFYKSILRSGRLPRPDENGRSNEVVVSIGTAKKLQLKLGDKLKVFFFKENEAKGFAPQVVGIYKTGAEEYDKLFALCSYKDLVSNVIPRQLYKTALREGQTAVTHLEVKVDDFNKLQEVSNSLNDNLPYTMRTETIMNLQSQVFDWLGYLDKNIQIILLLMALVASINMVTAILILIVDNTRLIGLLQSLGASHKNIVRLFVQMSVNIIGMGMLIANGLALTLICLQSKYRFITLDETNYYTSYVPVDLQFTDLLFVNIGTLVICILVILLPAQYIARITPVKALAFR